MKYKKKFIISGVLFLLGMLAEICALNVAGFADWYTQHIYSALVASVGRFFGAFSFSVTELLLYFLLLLFLITFLLTLVKAVRLKKKRQLLLPFFGNVAVVCAVLFLLYVGHCGINYGRRSFAAQEQLISQTTLTTGELTVTCLWLTQEVNTLSDQVERNEAAQMLLPENVPEAARTTMQNLAEHYPSLAGYYPLPKAVSFAPLLSYQGLGGVYAPFTIEANYNGAMPAYCIPFTACHELSHLRGFMREDEANYIAFLACTNANDTNFRYSGYLNAWSYCMSTLERQDAVQYGRVRALLHSDVRADLHAGRLFWHRYEGRISQLSERINDTYLKANGSADGTNSYNRMVNLVVAHYLAVN